MKVRVTAKEIDALLPQTQCGLCSYKGCMPYAKALEQNEASIDLCPPGGVAGLKALGNLLEIDPTPFISDMEKRAKSPLQAVIREAECIGCTKCITACPVDAIVGAAKQMHTVIARDCTGCELCVAPCPVDCIDMIEVTSLQESPDYYREKHLKHNNRVEKTSDDIVERIVDKNAYILAALKRAKNK